LHHLLQLSQVKDTLAALQERFKALKLDGGGLPISRLQVPHLLLAVHAESPLAP
jgi:hypothetical protein